MSASSEIGARRETEFPVLAENDKFWELWDSMIEIYGHKFLSSYGERPSWGWYHTLNDLSFADFGVGIMKCRDRGADFPPDATQFYDLCTGRSLTDIEIQQKRNSEIVDPHKLLPALPVTPEQAKANLAAIRAANGL